MRALIWICLVLAALWGGWWFTAKTAVEQGAEAWFAQAQANGLVAERQGLTVRGFPSRIDTTVTGLHLVDPSRGIGWRAPLAQVFSMTWKPWHLIGALPSGQVVELPGQAITLDGQGMLGSVLLHPGSALALDRAQVEGADLRLTSTLGWTAGAGRLLAAVAGDPTRQNAYRLGLTLSDVAPDVAFLAALSGSDLPALISRLHLDAHAVLTAPLDRHAAPEVVALEVADLSLTWGSLQITGKGRLMPGPDGLADGQIDLRITGWRRALPVLAAMGVVTPDMAQALERGLEGLAQPDPDVLEMPLRARGGRLTLGPLPLGPAPRLR